jgi:hypothetical protein
MPSTEEIYLSRIEKHLAVSRGIAGSQIIIGGGTPDVATGNIIAIECIGTTYELGVVVGNCDGLSGATLLVPKTIYGQFSSVEAGPAATDVFLVYFGI